MCVEMYAMKDGKKRMKKFIRMNIELKYESFFFNAFDVSSWINVSYTVKSALKFIQNIHKIN